MGTELVRAITPHGPGWIIALVVVVAILGIAYKRVLPAWESSRAKRDDAESRRIDAEIAIEAKREERKASESKAREERDIERGRMEGRWVEAMERSNDINARSAEMQASTVAAVEGIRASMDALSASIEESRVNSRELGRKVDEIHSSLIGKRP